LFFIAAVQFSLHFVSDQINDPSCAATHCQMKSCQLLQNCVRTRTFKGLQTCMILKVAQGHQKTGNMI